MTALDLAKLDDAREALRDAHGDLGAALLPLLGVAEHFVKHGIRWGLVEETAAKIVDAVVLGLDEFPWTCEGGHCRANQPPSPSRMHCDIFKPRKGFVQDPARYGVEL